MSGGTGAGTHAAADTFAAGNPEQFEIEFVYIDGGNAADDTGFGGVAHDVRMAITEVSRWMVESYNFHGEPTVTMADMSSTGGNGPDRPATGISWLEAAHFVNWLNVDRGFPPAYKMVENPDGGFVLASWSDGDPGFDPRNPFRNSMAFYFLPSEDEWYKAAYYDPSSETYWDYATGSDTPPVPVTAGTSPGTAVYSQSFSAGPADISDAGGLSPLGTMAQNGNVYEWVESPFTSTNSQADEVRVERGGDWNNNPDVLQSGERDNGFPTSEVAVIGFRVASVGDSDGDGLYDNVDLNDDNDGFDDLEDDFPYDPTEWLDTDHDGIGNNADLDDDGDSLPDDLEPSLYSTDPLNPDTDGDGVYDGTEIDFGSNPLANDDTDYDGINNLEETTGALNPWVNNSFQSAPGDPTDPLENDTDNDGIRDLEEITLGADGYITNPNRRDSDFDGIADEDEIVLHGTDPTKEDSDDDGLKDRKELFFTFTDPSVYDTDGDGIRDADEDLDGDGYTNWEEVEVLGTDPVDGLSQFAPKIVAEPSGLYLVFPTLTIRDYQIDESADFSDPESWTQIATVNGNGSTVSYALPPPSGPPRFYRVTVIGE